MFVRIRHITILVLGLTLFAVAVVCGSPGPQEEARVEQALAVLPTPSSKSEKFNIPAVKLAPQGGTVEEAKTNYALRAPWDTRSFRTDLTLLPSQCPKPVALPTKIPDRLENGTVDGKAWAPLTNISENIILLLSDKAVSEGNSAAASCVLDYLYYWAQNDAFVNDSECQKGGSHFEHGYDRSNFTNGVLTIPYLQIRNASTLDETKRSAILSWFESVYLCSQTRAEGMLLDAQTNGLGPHNQTYPALLAVATTAIVLEKTDGFNWAIEKYRESIATISADGTAANEITHKKGWTIHYHTLIENFSVHIALLGEINGFMGLFDDPALVRLTNLVLDSYDDPTYVEELTGYAQTQDPLTTPWNLSWVEHLKRYISDPRVSQLATQFQWQLMHSHTGGSPEYWWSEHWE